MLQRITIQLKGGQTIAFSVEHSGNTLEPSLDLFCKMLSYPKLRTSPFFMFTGQTLIFVAFDEVAAFQIVEVPVEENSAAAD